MEIDGGKSYALGDPELLELVQQHDEYVRGLHVRLNNEIGDMGESLDNLDYLCEEMGLDSEAARLVADVRKALSAFAEYTGQYWSAPGKEEGK